MRQVDTRAQALYGNSAAPLVGDLDATGNSVVHREDGVRQVRSHIAHFVMYVNNKGFDVLVGAKSARLAVQRRLPVLYGVRLVSKVGDNVPSGLFNLHGWDTKVSPTGLRKLAPKVGLRRPTSRVDEVRRREALRNTAAKVIRDKVPRLGVDVETVRDIGSVEGEGSSGGNDCCP